jgi:hypothetical protein
MLRASWLASYNSLLNCLLISTTFFDSHEYHGRVIEQSSLQAVAHCLIEKCNERFDMYIWTTIPCGGVVAHSSYDFTPLLSGDRYPSVPVPLHIRGTSALIAKCSFQSLCLLSTWYSQIYYTLLQPRYSYTLSLSLRIIHNRSVLV